MTDTIYTGGLDDLVDWETGDFIWLLAAEPYFPNQADEFIDDVTDEVTLPSYVRVAPTGRQRIEDNTGLFGQIVYKCDSPDFGLLETTESPRWLVLARLVGATPVDSSSTLICALDLGVGGVPPLATENYIVHLDPRGFATSRQVSG